MTEPTTPEHQDVPDQDVTTTDGYAEGQTNDPEGAEREEPAGQDYAGSGF